MTPREEVFSKAIGEALGRMKDKLLQTLNERTEAAVEAARSTIRPEVTLTAPKYEFPTPVVRNEVKVEPTPVQVTNCMEPPLINVHVDLAPVAEALTRFAEFQGVLLAELTKLAKAILALEPPVVQSPEVSVAAPSVTVQVPDRPKRSVRITHSDGTESTVTEM